MYTPGNLWQYQRMVYDSCYNTEHLLLPFLPAFVTYLIWSKCGLYMYMHACHSHIMYCKHQFVNIYMIMFCISVKYGVEVSLKKPTIFETIVFYRNYSNIHNESIYLLCWLISMQYSATTERKEMSYKDTNFSESIGTFWTFKCFF